MRVESKSVQIGLLQIAIHVVQNRHAGEYGVHWKKTNKVITILNDVWPLFLLSHCVSCSPVWRICSASKTSCNGPIYWMLISLGAMHVVGSHHVNIALWNGSFAALQKSPPKSTTEALSPILVPAQKLHTPSIKFPCLLRKPLEKLKQLNKPR